MGKPGKTSHSWRLVNPTSITISLIFLIAILFIIGVPILDLVELKTYDLRLVSRQTKRPAPEVVLLVIDEKSVDIEGRWPWPRTKIAGLINICSQDGAKVISFDIGFLEPDENSNLGYIRQFERKLEGLKIDEPQLMEFIEESRLKADNDRILADAIKKSSAHIVLGYFFHMDGPPHNDQGPGKEVEKGLKGIHNSRYQLLSYGRQGPMGNPFIMAHAPQANIEMLNRVADGSGYFNILPDRDGMVRWLPLVIKCGAELYCPLAIQAVREYLDRPQMTVQLAEYGVEGIWIGKQFIPTDENGQMLVNFLGPEKTFPHYSAGDILNGSFRKGAFKDKIVLVGATAVGIYDLRNTPFSPIFPGVEIHATAIDNILNKNILHKPKWSQIFDILAILILAMITGLAVPRLGALKGLLFATGLFAMHILVSRWLFIHADLLVNIVYPLTALVIVYVSLTAYYYLTEERERRKIKGAFTHYVSTSVVNEIIKYPEKLKLGGDTKELSVLFSDIRGFTTISEGLSSEGLVELLNEYLTIMTDVVFKYDGTLDKYMGDAIMAIYGAPLDQEDHALRACCSALDMMEDLKKLNNKWIQEGKSPLDIGIGINTGRMMVGNMGSRQRFDFTVMGDAVNLGSRLEGANKNYKTNILISQYTYEQVNDELICMELDSVRVKGKTRPVTIYQLVGRSDVEERLSEAIRFFTEGRGHYREQDWDKAIEMFQAAMAADSQLSAAGIYLGRCLNLKNDPPPSDWDGVFAMKTK